MDNFVLLLLVIKTCIADIQVKNGDATSISYIEFYLQGVDGSSCTDTINGVQIWNDQQSSWIYPNYQSVSGAKFGFACNNVSQCQFNLPISILLSTTQHNPITLTNIISTYNSGDIFTTSCQLCRGTETCYGPTYTPTYNP
eukprot:479257_1